MADGMEGAKGCQLIKQVNLMHTIYRTLSNDQTGPEQIIIFSTRIVERLRRG